MHENITGRQIEDSQHLFNTHSTDIQHLSNVGLIENAQTPYKEINSEPQEFIQHTARDEGERGCVEQEPFDDVLQNSAHKGDLLITQKLLSQKA